MSKKTAGDDWMQNTMLRVQKQGEEIFRRASKTRLDASQSHLVRDAGNAQCSRSDTELDVLFREFSNSMNNISQLCKACCLSEKSDSLTEAERQHWDRYHSGVGVASHSNVTGMGGASRSRFIDVGEASYSGMTRMGGASQRRLTGVSGACHSNVREEGGDSDVVMVTASESSEAIDALTEVDAVEMMNIEEESENINDSDAENFPFNILHERNLTAKSSRNCNRLISRISPEGRDRINNALRRRTSPRFKPNASLVARKFDGEASFSSVGAKLDSERTGEMKGMGVVSLHHGVNRTNSRNTCGKRTPRKKRIIIGDAAPKSSRSQSTLMTNKINVPKIKSTQNLLTLRKSRTFLCEPTVTIVRHSSHALVQAISAGGDSCNDGRMKDLGSGDVGSLVVKGKPNVLWSRHAVDYGSRGPHSAVVSVCKDKILGNNYL